MRCGVHSGCQAAQANQMSLPPLVEAILEQQRKLLGTISEEDVGCLIEEILEADRIFCAAQGRSGNVLRCFAMRLMQLGYKAFFVGETITPNIETGDLLIVLSGSGQTTLTREWVRIAQEQKARAFGILGVENSPIGRAVDRSLTLSAGSKFEPVRASYPPQPPGSLFEQVAFILLESVVLGICGKRGIDPATILESHANLE